MKIIQLLEGLGKVDRRIIFLLVFLAVLIPMFVSKTGQIRPEEPVKQAYAAVDRLKPGDVLMVSIDYDATSEPELKPMLEAILYQAFQKNLKVVMTGQLALGLPLGQISLDKVVNDLKEKHGIVKEYGVDYINLGYRPGYVSVILAIGREIRDLFQSDYQSKPINQFPIMEKIHNYDDIGLILVLAHGATIDTWVQYANGRFGVKIIAGLTAISAPDAYVYLNAGQLSGLIGGLAGAAQYETLVGVPGGGTRGMPAQSWSHILIIILVIIGNAGYFITKYLGGK